MPDLPEWIKLKECRRVVTKDAKGRDNGFLVDVLNRNDEIFSTRRDETFQQVYYSSVYSGRFKGFHIHPYKYDTVSCILGKALLVFYPQIIMKSELDIAINPDDLVILPVQADEKSLTVSFPSKYPHGYYGVSDLAYILNYRNPAWHLGDNYQYDYKMENIEAYLQNWIKQHDNS